MKLFGSDATNRSVVLIAFFVLCGLVFAWLLGGTGIKRPFVDSGEYTVKVIVDDVDNLVRASQVQIAGVKIGSVRSVELVDGGAEVELAIQDDVAPLHEGVTVRVGERSLVGETYLAVEDGDGAKINSGSQLPTDAVQPSVQVRDVLADLDDETRGDLGSLLRSVGEGTKGTRQDVDHLVRGLGNLGREGHTALDAIAAQSEDLTALARNTTAVLEALDTGQGQLASLVSDANVLTKATSGQRASIEASLRKTPTVLDTARVATGSLSQLAGALSPVAADLRAAAPDLTVAVRTLPETTRDLNAMLDPMSDVLDRAPATLKRIPRTTRDLNTLIPTARVTLADINPMLSYIRPYGPELAAYFANFNAVLNYKDENGASYLRLTPLVNTHSPQLPISTNGLLGNYTNAYPAPGSGARPGPFTGDVPRVTRQEP